MLFTKTSDQATKTNWYVEWPSCSYSQESKHKFHVESRSPVCLLRELLCPVPSSLKRMQRLCLFCYSSQQLVAKKLLTVPPKVLQHTVHARLKWQAGRKLWSRATYNFLKLQHHPYPEPVTVPEIPLKRLGPWMSVRNCLMISPGTRHCQANWWSPEAVASCNCIVVQENSRKRPCVALWKFVCAVQCAPKAGKGKKLT